MALLNAKTFLMAKTEVTYGTDVFGGGGGTTAQDAIPCKTDITISPLEGKEVDRNLMKPFFGQSGLIRTESFAKIDFSTEFSNHPSATTPRWDSLIQACNFSQTSFAAITDEAIGVAFTVPSLSVIVSSVVTPTLAGGTITIGSETRKIVTHTAATATFTIDTPFSTVKSIGTTVTSLKHASGAIVLGARTIATAALGAAKTTITLGASAVSTDNIYNGSRITIKDAGGTNEETVTISSYNGATKVATLSAPLLATRLITAKYSISAFNNKYSPHSKIDTSSKSLTFYFF